ncbi:MAG: winged helix DNA-binding domain-containing protein [Anaerolineales bacterium]|uniref:AlkZ-related protein n=1 Tax=Candidatus Villigracilis proximus TaxID=3140683 RepID=UPI0031366BD9|nr:winged helix DNA-binding domain-containing protein [Anaerolineales bacterium]
MPQINLKKLQTYHTRTFHLPPAKRLSSPSQALTFVNACGFTYFWPIKGISLPSLWTAVTGDRPVADKHDDPGHITWGWKDDALDKKIWYYGKILRGKATIISLEIAPYFYALSENYGSPEEDYLIAYHEGRLTQASKQVYETLLDNGALNTLDLRKMAKLSNAKDSEFNKALEQLQRDFKILPVGVAQAGAWKYSHIYEIVTRHYPDLSEQARTIKESQARAKLLELYFSMLGAADLRDVNKLFGWGNDVTKKTIAKLVESEKLTRAEHPKLDGEWLTIKDIL